MAKKTAEQIHEDGLRLEEYRLEFLFRNKKIGRLIQDCEDLMAHYRLLGFKLEFLCERYVRESTRKIGDNDPQDLKELKTALNESRLALEKKEEEVIEVLKDFGVHIDWPSPM